jgi:hypothetical protein
MLSNKQEALADWRHFPEDCTVRSLSCGNLESSSSDVSGLNCLVSCVLYENEYPEPKHDCVAVVFTLKAFYLLLYLKFETSAPAAAWQLYSGNRIFIFARSSSGARHIRSRFSRLSTSQLNMCFLKVFLLEYKFDGA